MMRQTLAALRNPQKNGSVPGIHNFSISSTPSGILGSSLMS